MTNSLILYNKKRKGAALLVVLFIVMIGSIVSMGFLSRCDGDMFCSENSVQRAKMDYLAESGLEYAKGIILKKYGHLNSFSQDQFQIDDTSDKYLDIDVAKIDEHTFDINSLAYENVNGNKVAKNKIKGTLRLDPCIAYYAGDNKEVNYQMTVYGDVCYAEELDLRGKIYGDAYSYKWIAGTGTLGGSKNEYQTTLPVELPGITCADFSSGYIIDSQSYSVETLIDSDYLGSSFPSCSLSNPANVYYSDGDLRITGDLTVYGTLVVKHDLTIKNDSKLTIVRKPGYNLPAIVCGHLIRVEDRGVLNVTGYVQAYDKIEIKKEASAYFTGSVYSVTKYVEARSDSLEVVVQGDPEKAAIKYEYPDSTVKSWNPATGAFFRSIERQSP